MHEVQRPPFRPRRYVAPSTLGDALAILAELGDRARPVAGGTDLMVELDRRVGDEVETLVDLTRIPGLDGVTRTDGWFELGPLVTHNQVAIHAGLATHAPALVQACLEVGSPGLRNRATVVGNLVTASPANDTISALTVLDATLTISSVDGDRRVALADFHTGVRATVLRTGELVTAVSFPQPAESARSVFVKLGLRRAQAISVVHIAVLCDLDDAGTVREARLALGSVAPTIVRIPAAEALLVGSDLSPDIIDAAAAAAARSVHPIDDLRAPATYRTDMIEVMVRRALRSIVDGPLATPSPAPTLGGPLVPADGVAVSLGPDHDIVATVNGVEVTGQWSSGSLLDWLRERPGLTGTKEGCAEGECGACTIHLDGVAALSCLVPAGRAHSATLTTVEGLARTDGLHPVQQAFVDNAAVQCGYCIPGFLVAGAALLADDPAPDRETVTLGLAGNLCRCTGYAAIHAALAAVAETRAP